VILRGGTHLKNKELTVNLRKATPAIFAGVHVFLSDFESGIEIKESAILFHIY
jgi:hypothetical protein